MRHVLRPIFDRVVIKELEPDRVRRSGEERLLVCEVGEILGVLESADEEEVRGLPRMGDSAPE